MTQPSPPSLADEFAAALDWWRDAGVDHDYNDDVTEWLAEPEAGQPSPRPTPTPAKKAEPAPPPPPKKIGGEQETWPAELVAFQKWWVADSSIDDGGAFPPIAPIGGTNAALMAIVPEPEESDSDTLLSGQQGRLLRGFLQATGFDEGQIYIAAALRRHTPMPDWPALRSAGLGDLLQHHIALAAPKRIISFGRNIPPLLGNDTAQSSVILQNINHEGRSIPAMGVASLSELLRSASRRKKLWHQWLEWTDD